jgi:uncharacterized membrane protein
VLRRLNPVPLWNRLTSTYWFLPALVTLLAIVTATMATEIDRRYPDGLDALGWAYGGGADGARSLLSAIAGSIITVVSVTFSVLVVALTVSSQHFGPRLLNSFMRDRTAQLVLGSFTGLFVYCLVVLRTVQGAEGDGYEEFVPHLAVTGAVGLTLLAVAMLIFYVHHVARSMQVSEITARVAEELEASISRLYPEDVGEGTEPPVPVPPPVPAGAVRLRSRSSGYLQEIDTEGLMECAIERNVQLWLLKRPGEFVVTGVDLAAAYPASDNPEGLEEACCEAFRFGRDRTATQDAAFAIQQLVEVALRALSPGVNEPFTAITCVDRLTQGLAGLLSRRIPSALRHDSDGVVRVVARPYSSAELLQAGFEPIAAAAAGNPSVGERLLESLVVLAGRAHRDEDRAAIAGVADAVVKVGGAAELESSRERLAARYRDVQRALTRNAEVRMQTSDPPSRG